MNWLELLLVITRQYLVLTKLPGRINQGDHILYNIYEPSKLYLAHKRNTLYAVCK